MDIFDLFFGSGQCINTIFLYGSEPKESNIFELTQEQYEELFKDDSIDKSKKWYTWLPTKHSYESDDLLVLDEDDKNSLIEAAKIIDNYISASERKFNDYKEKLEYVAKIIPPVFTQGTEFSRNK